MQYVAPSLQGLFGWPPVPFGRTGTTALDRDLPTRPAGDKPTEVLSTALEAPSYMTWDWWQPQPSTVADASGSVRWLERIFTFVRPQEVQAFLSANSHLIQLLFEARRQVSRYFGQDAPVFLEVVSDPESANDKQLFALVGTSLSPQEALGTLDRLDQDWWLDVSDQSHGNLVVDVKFL